MKIHHWAVMAGLSLIVASDAFAQTQAQATAPAAGSKNVLAWAAKPAKLPPYVAPNKLVWRLADVLARHKGKQSWMQPVFHSRDYDGAWISMAPGEMPTARKSLPATLISGSSRSSRHMLSFRSISSLLRPKKRSNIKRFDM